MTKHPCENHKVRESGHTPSKSWKKLYCFTCDREFVGKWVWNIDEKDLVEKGPDIKNIF